MENIQEQLKKQYNMSIEFYNKGDYEHYFFHTRKSIELNVITRSNLNFD